jgi:c-di-GMP-binding flagellar brake protein YcgR
MITELDLKPAVHDRVLVEAELDGQSISFRAVAVNVMPTAIWLGLVLPQPQLEQLKRDQPLQLTFRRDGTGMIAASSFVGHLRSTHSRLFAVSWPDDLRLIQRRAHLRLDAQCPVEYTVVSQSATGSPGQTGDGICCNLCAGGVQFVVRGGLDATVAVGDELDLRVALGRDGVVLAEAVVVRVEDATTMVLGPDEPVRAGSTGPRSLIAVRFESISDVDQDKIVRYIFSIQRQNREGPSRTA